MIRTKRDAHMDESGKGEQVGTPQTHCQIGKRSDGVSPCSWDCRSCKCNQLFQCKPRNFPLERHCVWWHHYKGWVFLLAPGRVPPPLNPNAAHKLSRTAEMLANIMAIFSSLYCRSWHRETSRLRTSSASRAGRFSSADNRTWVKELGTKGGGGDSHRFLRGCLAKDSGLGVFLSPQSEMWHNTLMICLDRQGSAPNTKRIPMIPC